MNDKHNKDLPDYVKHIHEWADKVSLPEPNLGGLPTCPFAKSIKHDFKIIKTEMHKIEPPEHTNFDLIMYVVEDNIPAQMLLTYAEKLNKKYPQFVFLSDPYPNGHGAGVDLPNSTNGKYNIILCQPKDRLHEARKVLAKTKYYSHFDPEFLKKMLGDDYGLLD